MAAYNAAATVEEAVRSALGQTWSDLEVVVVDDGSQDETPGVLETLSADSRVRRERIPHAGHSRAKNHAVSLARGKYLAFLDADDVWLPEKLARQLPLFEGRPEVGVVYCRRSIIDAEGRERPPPEDVSHRGCVLEALLIDNFICFSSAVVRREVVERVGSFDESLVYPIDYDFWLRSALDYAFDFVDAPLVKYRRANANMTSSMKLMEKRRQIDQVMERFWSDHADRVPRGTRRRAEAARAMVLGFDTRDQSRWESVGWYARAIAWSPWSVQAWKGLGAALVPESIRKSGRVLSGRGVQSQKAAIQ
jgi:glycosyltransferase involved in cell wall biosynthesis